MPGLPKQLLEFPFSRGLNQQSDARLINAPELVRAVNFEFDEVGGLRLRHPFASIGTGIFGGGTISNIRQIYAYGAELIAFTSTALYSWSSQRSAWVLKGTHLAVKNAELPVFVNTGDQVDCDRAELSGTAVYCWSEVVLGATEVFVAARDTSTGAVLLTPTDVAPGQHPRVVALGTTIVLFYESGTGALVARTVSPTTLAVSNSTTILAAASFNTYYDVEKIPGSDNAILACRRDVTTSYEILKVSSALGVTASTKARTCDGPIAITCSTDGNYAQIARGNGSNIQGDLVAISNLADVNTAQALGSGTSTINQITAAFSDTTNCRVFWHSNEATGATAYQFETNTVTVANVIGTETRLAYRVGVASRAFAYNGEVYVWTVFAGASSFSGANPASWFAQLQNTYFLYRADGHLVTKAAWQRAGGLATNGLLPGVALTSGSTSFTFCGGERRVTPIGDPAIGQLGYADRGPRDITITFDSNEARRCARSGETLYIAGGLPLQYDGRELVELGFPIYPWYFGAIEVGAGNLTDAVYTLKVGWRYPNAKGESERSTSATAGQVTIASGPNGIEIPTGSFPPLHTTRKSGVVVEVWRTAGNADRDAPFHLVTSSDPAATSNPNRYVLNDATATGNSTFDDEYADATLTTKQPHPENGAVLENMAPPSATIIAATSERVFLAGIAGAPRMVAYSKLRGVGELATFHESNAVMIPEAGGDITGLAFNGETLVVLCETALYALDGEGFGNVGNTDGSQNYRVRQLPADVGAVSQEACASTPAGVLFKSLKGWCLLNRGWSIDYIGGGVCDYDSDTVVAVHVVEAQQQVRCLTTSRMLVFDYTEGAVLKWGEWSISDGVHACIWNGTYHYASSSAVKAEQSTYDAADYAGDVEVLVHLGALQGFARLYRILILGEYRSAHSSRVRVGGYTEDSYFDDETWTPSPTTVGGEMQFQHGPSRQQLQVVRIRITSSTTTGEKLKLSAISLEVGLKAGAFRHLPAAQRQ